MKIRFTASSVLLSALSLVLTISLAGAADAAEKELVYVSKVEVTKIKDGRFKVTASGDSPSAGWKVTLVPMTYIKEPDIWLIDANGIRPDDPVAQMLTPWTESIEMGLGPRTKKVAVNGRGGKSVTAEVPHDATVKSPASDKDKTKSKDKDKGKDKDRNKGKDGGKDKQKDKHK